VDRRDRLPDNLTARGECCEGTLVRVTANEIGNRILSPNAACRRRDRDLDVGVLDAGDLMKGVFEERTLEAKHVDVIVDAKNRKGFFLADWIAQLQNDDVA
jgi:hypothetical protein